MTTNPSSEIELCYLAAQGHGRLATVGPSGEPQNRPVSFSLDPATGTVDIGGLKLAASRKSRNVAANPLVSFVVDDHAPESSTTSPFRGRGIEIRGHSEARYDETPPNPYFSGELIRIHPVRVIAWNLAPAAPGVDARDVPSAPR
ncbi:PPOX class F420-dependent oxidoreductase [Kitasatospora sp. NPDC089509]|uniref:PPOX class F420-dependent oxidoreductase n=1 Tax=Kitasatospora sp. NPDC089509 TaxID=3364079 RepID=UPI00383047A7